MRLDKIRQHPKFQSLNPEDQATVIKNFINREWSKYETHKSYASLPDEDKEKVRSGFMSRFYGDALKEQPFVDAKQPNPMFEGLTPAGSPQSVHAPVEYPEDPEREGKINRTWGEAAKDTAIDAANSVIGLGEAGVGIADMASFNLAGKGLSKIGYDPAQTKGILAQGYSDSRKQANKEVSEAKGFLGTVDALLDNPSVAFGAIVESSALTASGAAIARYAAVKLLGSALAKNGITAGSAAAKDFAAKFFLNPSVQSKIVMAGAGAEGAQTAGLIQEQGRQAGRDWSDTILPAMGAGATTAAIGGLTSKIPGLRDAEASLATAGLGGRIAAKQAVPNILKGTVKEGLEETLQSGQENALTNVALGRPWREGNAEAAGMGLVVGAGQGGAMMTGSSMLNLKRAVSADILQSKNVDEAISKFQQGTGILQGAQNDILQKGGNPNITEAETPINLERATGLLSSRTEVAIPQKNEGNAERVNDLPAGESPLSIIPSENKTYDKIVLPAVEPNPSQIEPIAEPIQGEPNDPVQNIGDQITPRKTETPSGEVEVRPTETEQDTNNGQQGGVARTDRIVTESSNGNRREFESEQVENESTTSLDGKTDTKTGQNSVENRSTIDFQPTTDTGASEAVKPEDDTSTTDNRQVDAGFPNEDIRIQDSAEIKGGGQISPVEPTGKLVQESIPDKEESTNQDITAQGTPPEASGIAPTTEATASAPSGGVVEIAKQVEKSLKYDGTNLSLHQFTAYDGPAKGATFSVKNPTQEEIQAGYDKVVKAFTKPTVKSVRQEITKLNAQIKNKPTAGLKAELADAKTRLTELKKSEYAAKQNAVTQSTMPEYAKRAGIKTAAQANKKGISRFIPEAKVIADQITEDIAMWIPGEKPEVSERLAEEMLRQTMLEGGRDLAIRSLAIRYEKDSKGADSNIKRMNGKIAKALRDYGSKRQSERDELNKPAAPQRNTLTSKQQKIFDQLQESGAIKLISRSEVEDILLAAGVDPKQVKYSVRTKPAPKKTIKAYKLFKVKKGQPGKLFALFVDANTPIDIGVWLDAEAGELTDKGKVKSKLGPLAYRPGWHGGDMPVATHIGSGGTTPTTRPKDQVWAEVEFPADVDWQKEANSRARISKKGKPVLNTAHITDQVPEDGHYRYKTNSNMTGSWIIAGSMKVNRILSDNEVSAINEKDGVSDLKRDEPFDFEGYGFDVKYSKDGKKIEGFTLPDGTVYLIKENIKDLWPVIRHEIAIHSRKLLLADKEFAGLLESLKARQNDESATGEAIRAAMAKVPSDTNSEHYLEETLGYMVTDAPEVGMVRRFIAMIKKAMVSLGFDPSLFTISDISALADSVLMGKRGRIESLTPNISGSDTAKIQKIKQSRPHIDEIEFDTISAAILSDNIKDIPLTRTAMAVLSDMVSEGLASNELLGKFDSAKVKADFNESARKLVKKRTDKELEDIEVADLELLEDLTDFVKEYGPKKVKDAIAKEEKKLEELAKPKLISSHKNYTLSESIVGTKWKVSKNSPAPWNPTDKIHIVAIDETDGPKKKKVENVQRVVEAAVPRISEDVKAVRFILPDGTEYTVLNNKTALRSFKKLVSKIYTPVPKVRKGSTSVNQTNKAKKTFDWGEKTIAHGEWVSDGTMIVKGFTPPTRPTQELNNVDTLLVSYQQMAEKANPAEIRYYTSGETDTVVAKEPVLQMGEFNAQAIIMDSITNKRFNVSQGKLNIVESIYPDVEYRISPDGVVFGYNEGEFIAAVMPMQGKPVNADKAKSYGLYSMGEFADTPVIMEMPELVELATELMNGNRPQLVDKFRKSGVKGQFMPSGPGGIKILKELGADFHQALKTMAHEIGHLIDYKDADTMSRGNILGRIASLKKYMKHYLEEKPGSPGVITEADRKRLMKEARLLTKREASELIDEVITTETPVTPEQVLAVLKGMETDPEPTADVISFIFTASTAVKKSIGLQAMKGLSPEEMAHLKTYIEVKTGSKIEQPSPTNKDVYEKFKKLVKEEIAKRNLISKEVITEELKLFTQLWKPFNVWGNAKYTKYRFSSEELYADALSGILVNPQMVQRVAPEFYKGFFNYIDNKPEASEIWGEIAKRIGRGPVEVSRARIKRDYEMFKRGEDIRAELAKGEESQGFFDTLALTLSDKNHFLNKALRQSADKDKAAAVINEQKELDYIPSEVDAYLFEINKTIQKELDDNNLTVHDLDVVAMRKHIIANREGMLSTEGYGSKTSTDDLKILKDDWGEEKYNKVEELLNKFRAIRDKRIYPLMEESGLYSEEFAKYMNETVDYTKVSVNHHLNKKFGEGAGGRVYKALGTLSEVNSPVTATILQDISLIRAARINKSKRSILPLLQEVGSLKPAKGTFNGKFMVAAEPDEANERIFSVMINGNMENYYVSKNIAEAYEFDPYTANQVMEAWNFVASGTRQLFISKNPVWMARNPVRDFKGTVTKNKEIGLRHMPFLAWAYAKSVPEAFQDAWKVKRSETIDWLMTNRALAEDRIYDGRDLSMDTELDRLQTRFKLSTKSNQEASKFQNVWAKWVIRNFSWQGINRNADNAGRAMEILSKIAGAKYLLQRGVPKQEVLNKVRNGLIGTPNWKEKGTLHSITNSIFMFSNIAVQGLKSHIAAAKANPGDYIWKNIALNVVPTVIMFFAAKGFFDDEEDDGTITGGGPIKRIMAGVPEYNLAHYSCTPLFLTKDNQSVWLQAPRDYEGQVLGAVTWKMLNGNFTGKGSALSELYNVFPYKIHPIINSALYLKDVYISGINQVDDYMGRNKNSDEAMDVGGWMLAKEVAKNIWRDTGGGTLYKPEYDDIKRDRSTAEMVLNLWGVNAIGAYIQISDRGVSEKVFKKYRELDLQATKQNVAINKSLSKMSQDEKMIMAEIAPKLKDRIVKQGLLAKNTAFTRGLAGATSQEKLAIFMQEMAGDMKRKKNDNIE
jgi:hypothetical protein